MTRLPRRTLLLLVVLVVVGLVASVFVARDRAVSTTLAHGASTSPPWPAPADKRAKAVAADLPNVYGLKLAEHVHAHLSITIDGEPATVPGEIGLDEKNGFATALHTHDTSGIVHVESPTKRDFTLGQFFTEWGVRLDTSHVGAAGGDVAEVLTVFVDGERRAGDPASIVLRDLDDIDLVVAPAGTVARPSAPFDWPPQYR
ncbi:hypothetical protein [Frondihabitans sp. 762G35]|uniref:hypothetical protein n=1 Tax=Frondihabitans sp. 762G35 TaxID=1446794 RepID=UPI000F4E3DFA|nr:hypothetical protein [Frondihabitans sp. 762G35]